MKKALITAAGPRMHEVLNLSEPTFKQFSDAFGYELIVERNLKDGPKNQGLITRKARWEKINLFEKYLPSYNLVVWMDADVMIKKFDKDIAEDVPDSCFQALVLEQFPHRFNPNTGVWVLRQDNFSYRFLQTVRDIGQQPHSWADQGAVCVALGWEIKDKSKTDNGKTFAKPVKSSEFLEGTAWLPPEWNPLGLASKWPSRTMHFANTPNKKRLSEMKKLLTSMRDSGLVKY